MKLKKNTRLITLLLLVSNLAIGQKSIVNKFTQKNFDNYKVFDNTYQLWWHNNMWFPADSDTIPYMVDDSNYKGIINYGVTFHSKDWKVFNFTEDYSIFYLNIEFISCIYHVKDSIVEIEGYIKDGWGKATKTGWNKTGNYIDVFVGEIKDTVTPLYFKNDFNSNIVEVKYKNMTIENYTVLDTFPSLYFKNFSHLITTSQRSRYFKVKEKINKNSILAFGARGCYSEFFDIGSMVFDLKKRKRKKIEVQDAISKKIIVRNRLVSEENESKDVEIAYYKYTEIAENYILTRKYASAKETYIDLAQKYDLLYARDIHNAVRCAILTRDYKNAYYWAEKLAHKGIPIKYFNANIFKNFKTHSEWKNFNVLYDSIYTESRKKINLNLKYQLEKLVEEDQNDYGLQNRSEPRVLYETTEKVTEKLIELIRAEGFPSEERIGVHVINDTILNSAADYNVLIRHAIQQAPKNLTILNELLNKSIEMLEYDSKRSPNNKFLHNSCFHIYKGNLYQNKSCGSNEVKIKKMILSLKNPYNFKIDNEDFVVTEYNEENPETFDKFYRENFNFIIKLTDDWKFHEK